MQTSFATLHRSRQAQDLCRKPAIASSNCRSSSTTVFRNCNCHRSDIMAAPLSRCPALPCSLNVAAAVPALVIRLTTKPNRWLGVGTFLMKAHPKTSSFLCHIGGSRNKRPSEVEQPLAFWTRPLWCLGAASPATQLHMFCG